MPTELEAFLTEWFVEHGDDDVAEVADAMRLETVMLFIAFFEGGCQRECVEMAALWLARIEPRRPQRERDGSLAGALDGYLRSHGWRKRAERFEDPERRLDYSLAGALRHQATCERLAAAAAEHLAGLSPRAQAPAKPSARRRASAKRKT